MTLVDFICRFDRTGSTVAAPDGRELDHVELCNAADAIGAALAARGVAPGDRVAAALPAGAPLIAALIGAAAIRAALVPIRSVDDEPTVRRALRSREVRLVLAAPNPPASVRAAAEAAGVALATLALDGRGLVLIDGEPVYDAHDRVAEPDDVALVALDGKQLTQGALVMAAGERGLEGLAAIVAVVAAPARHAA